jgi:hypothetical protein
MENIMTTQNTINWNPPATLYIYCADLYCKPCGMAIQGELEALNCDCPGGKSDCNGSCNWGELQGYHDDSDSWPQEYSRGEGESDTPDHCGKCSRFLGRNLTDDGIAYIFEHYWEDLDRDGVIGEVVQGWLDFYGISID